MHRSRRKFMKRHQPRFAEKLFISVEYVECRVIRCRNLFTCQCVLEENVQVNFCSRIVAGFCNTTIILPKHLIFFGVPAAMVPVTVTADYHLNVDIIRQRVLKYWQR